jgi:hypothetical protein
MALLNLLAFLWSTSAACNLAPITLNGKKFFYNNGNQFFVKGNPADLATGNITAKSPTTRCYLSSRSKP